MSSEIKIRVKEIIKDKLVQVKEKTGLSINYQVNFAIFKYLILDTKVPFWEIDTRPDPHYDVVNKLPEELKFCDGDKCEIEEFRDMDGKLYHARMKPKNIIGDKC